MATKKTAKTKTPKQRSNDTELANAKKELNEKSRDFSQLRETAEQNSTEATRAMLKQTALVFDVVSRYKGNNFNAALLSFRAETGLESGSKFSQFKRIGSVADQLLAVADRLPSGWSSLYAIASALTNKKHPVTLDALLNAKMKQVRLRTEANGDKTRFDCGVLSLNTYSTQSEVRQLVAFAGGRVPRVRIAPAYATFASIGLPELRIRAEHITSERIGADADELRNALVKVLKQFPWVVFEPESVKFAA